MATMKVIEILSESPESFEEACRAGVKKASESVRGITSAYVKEQTLDCDGDGNVTKFRVNLKITFAVQ